MRLFVDLGIDDATTDEEAAFLRDLHDRELAELFASEGWARHQTEEGTLWWEVPDDGRKMAEWHVGHINDLFDTKLTPCWGGVVYVYTAKLVSRVSLDAGALRDVATRVDHTTNGDDTVAEAERLILTPGGNVGSAHTYGVLEWFEPTPEEG